MKDLQRAGQTLPSDAPNNYEVLFSGSATSIDLPLESGIYYMKLTATVPDFWLKLEVNVDVFNESIVTMRFAGHFRAATQFIAAYFGTVQKLNDTTMRFQGRASQINFGTPTNTTRPVTRILKAVG